MVTEEELSQMSPEEVAEFQMQNCVFCQIASGKVPSRTVYSDEESVAVLDINPAARGHMLLLPKEHFPVMPRVPEHLVAHLFMVAKALSQAALKALQCKGTTIFVANGVAAGQKAPHFMIHIIPRSDGDGVAMGIPERSLPDRDVGAVAAVLKKAMAGKQNVEAEVVREGPARIRGRKGGAKKAGGRSRGYKKSGAGKFDLDAVSEMFSK